MERTNEEAEQDTAQTCDQILYQSARLMMDNGASLGLVMDRILTFAAAHAVANAGAFAAAGSFRSVASKIESGLFAHLEPTEGGTKH